MHQYHAANVYNLLIGLLKMHRYSFICKFESHFIYLLIFFHLSLKTLGTGQPSSNTSGPISCDPVSFLCPSLSNVGFEGSYRGRPYLPKDIWLVDTASHLRRVTNLTCPARAQDLLQMQPKHHANTPPRRLPSQNALSCSEAPGPCRK